MRKAYPAIRPYNTQFLKVTELHSIYVEECGDRAGIPVVFVHGGPGGGCKHSDRCFFDPEKYRVILFDQRGAGQSTPHAEIADNNTQALIADMETVRESLGVDRWVVFGGSWGSTLSLAYAQAHPDRVMALVLRGIFLCRKQDIHWFYQDGASHVFPDYWAQFVQLIATEERGDLLKAYYLRLTSGNELQRMAAAKSWSTWEGRCATLDPNPELVEHFADPHMALSLARIEAHYFVNDAFLKPDQLLKYAHKLKGIPGFIVHGRYDMVCPVDQAFALSSVWPEARLEIIRDAGHASCEPGIVDALVRATDEVAQMLGQETY